MSNEQVMNNFKTISEVLKSRDDTYVLKSDILLKFEYTPNRICQL